MQDALENELIERNPCISVKLPKPELRVRNFLPPDELPRFTKCLLSEPMGPMTVCTMLIFHLASRVSKRLEDAAAQPIRATRAKTEKL